MVIFHSLPEGKYHYSILETLFYLNLGIAEPNTLGLYISYSTKRGFHGINYGKSPFSMGKSTITGHFQ